MKTTLDLPDALLERTQAMATFRGQSVDELVGEALLSFAVRTGEDIPASEVAQYETAPWRRVFGKADPEEIGKIDAIIEDAFGRVDPDAWR